MDDDEEFDDSPIELNAKCRHVTAVVGRLGIGTDLSGNYSAVLAPERQLCGPERPILLVWLYVF